MKTSADISDCRRYRYSLTREWDERPKMVFIGLNPSTADETVDDPTIRRCVNFAKRDGYGGLIMLNLFAWRATDPSELGKVEDPVGPRNDLLLANEYHTIVAWGSAKMQLIQRRVWAATARLRGPLFCLGRCRDGNPRHPLYLKASTPEEVWREWRDV